MKTPPPSRSLAPIMGIETEYGLSGFGAKPRALDTAAGRLMQAVCARRPYLPDGGNGIFLSNGARFYLDLGKPEYCTPECSNPWDLVRHVRAGEQILARAAAAVAAEMRADGELMIQRSNVDYGGTTSTWGCHESYLYRCPPGHMAAQILPHLASRLVYSGAGGFDNRGSYTVDFTLSPRAWHMEHDVSAPSTCGRGVFHTKDEPLSSLYHRLHLLCGESNCSQTSLFLKVGTTALVVAMIDAGTEPGATVQLSSPLAAMRLFASDPACRRTVVTQRGATMTALDIQRHYLECAEAHLGAAFMPEWAPLVCRRWRAMLDALRGAPQSVAATLDWGIKHALYSDQARRGGVAWELLPLWNAVMTELVAMWRRHGEERPITYAAVTEARGPLGDEVARLLPVLRDHGLAWSDFASFLALRSRLFELDARFGQLNGAGIFAALDGAGVLRHRVDGVEAADHAAEEPPADTRAAVRGRLVRELHRDADRCVCSWTGVGDERRDRVIDLSDPYATTAEWHPRPRRRLVPGLRGDARERSMLTAQLRAARAQHGDESVEVAFAYNQLGTYLRSAGSLAESEECHRRALDLDQRLREPGHPKVPHRMGNLAIVLVMQGKRDEARPLLAHAWELKRGNHDLTSARLVWMRLAVALLDGSDPTVFIGHLKSLLELPELTTWGDIATTWDYEPMVANIRRGLRAWQENLLRGTAAGLNNRHHLLSLATVAKWRRTPPAALDVPWPE